jgi:hypothetical protein
LYSQWQQIRRVAWPNSFLSDLRQRNLIPAVHHQAVAMLVIYRRRFHLIALMASHGSSASSANIASRGSGTTDVRSD